MAEIILHNKKNNQKTEQEETGSPVFANSKLLSASARLRFICVVNVFMRMEEDEQLRSFLFLMTYLLLKRWRDISNANVQRRNEIQRRIRHRQYFFQRQRRMLLVRYSLNCQLQNTDFNLLS